MENHKSGPGVQDIEVAALLRNTIVRLVKLMRRETRNESQLSLTERSTLGLLYPDIQLPPSEIARSEKVTTQSMSQVINHLYDLGFITRTPSGDDKRKVFVSLTAAGRVNVEQRRQEKQEWLAQMLHRRVTPQEKEVLVESIRILNKLIDE
ncbi:MAG TPA: MarR family transcriptional regulator [Puia sp.]|jgi:DNA-binding MarR family transcriptional regulator|nr:MarR family transcriptional regulator [Puia sp.]